MRFNPDISNPTAGFYSVKNEETGVYEDREKTDLSLYEVGDTENLGWYWEPVTGRKSMWIAPYQNPDTGYYIQSYVVPIYRNSTLIGVTGLDIEMSYLTDLVDGITVYETGFAFMTDSALNVIHSKHSFDEIAENKPDYLDIANVEEREAVFSFVHCNQSMNVTFRQLDNGMCLAVTVPTLEVQKDIIILVVEVIMLAVCFIVIFLYIGIQLARNIASPLGELNKAAQRVAAGDLDVYYEYESEDEIGTLSKSFAATVKELKKRINYTDSLAYQDSLTGLNNATAYTRDSDRIRKKLQDAAKDYAVFIIDINGLKMVNDTFGHKVGNDLIIASGKVIGSTFGYENVYRIGGDEFVAIVYGAGEAGCIALEAELNEALMQNDGKIAPSLAIGFAVCSDGCEDFEQVFERADGALYKNKLAMKAKGITSKVLK